VDVAGDAAVRVCLYQQAVEASPAPDVGGCLGGLGAVDAAVLGVVSIGDIACGEKAVAGVPGYGSEQSAVDAGGEEVAVGVAGDGGAAVIGEVRGSERVK